MRSKGLDFDVVLKEAQRLGYAEADPTFDIEGVDAAHKVTLMSAIAFGIPVQFDKAYVEGITKLSAADIKYAEQLGYRIKLLGITKRAEKGIELRVHPSLVPSKRLIANVEGAMNAVVVQGDAVGTTLYYGKGAGSEPTASAVIADLVDIARLHTADPEHRVPHLAFQANTLQGAMDQLPVLPMSEVVTSYYLRLRVADQAGVLAGGGEDLVVQLLQGALGARGGDDVGAGLGQGQGGFAADAARGADDQGDAVGEGEGSVFGHGAADSAAGRRAKGSVARRSLP